MGAAKLCLSIASAHGGGGGLAFSQQKNNLGTIRVPEPFA